MDSLYWRQFMLSAGMVLLTMVLLGVSFYTLSYNYTVEEKRSEMRDRANLISQLSVNYLLAGDDTENTQEDALRSLAGVASRMTDVDFLICNRKGDVLLTSDAGLVGKSVRVPEEIVETTFSNENGYEGRSTVGVYEQKKFVVGVPMTDESGNVLGLVLACVMAGLFGVLIGIPALRLTGDYLAILTLGFGEIIRITLNNIDDVLGFKLFYGSKGLKNIPKYSNFTNVFLCVVITCFLIHAMMKSRHGRAVLAIRDNEIAAESCGIQTTYYKVMAFAFSAAFAGLAGGLYACYIGVLNPSTFGFMKSIEILVMVVLGGMGSMLGSILSATVLTILPEATRSFESYRMVVYSLVLVLMMIFRPGGLLGSYDFSLSRIVEKAMNGELFRKHTKKEAADHE